MVILGKEQEKYIRIGKVYKSVKVCEKYISLVRVTRVWTCITLSTTSGQERAHFYLFQVAELLTQGHLQISAVSPASQCYQTLLGQMWDLIGGHRF